MNEQDIFWNRAAETMSRDEYAKVQLDGLQRSLRRVWKNAFYRSRLQCFVSIRNTRRTSAPSPSFL